MKHVLLAILLISLSGAHSLNSQAKTKDPFLKWTTWLVLQAIPSPAFFEDRDDKNTGLEFGLEWQVIPFSYSFHTNKYLSSVSFFFINPVKRFSGSVEAFFEPSIVLGDFEYSELDRFMLKTGARVVIPLAQRGEYFSVSLGAGYYMQNSIYDERIDGITYEVGAYTLFGMVGLKFNYNQNALSRYSIGLYIKYY